MPLARNRANSSQSPARPNLTEIPLTPPILTQISPHSSLATPHSPLPCFPLGRPPKSNPSNSAPTPPGPNSATTSSSSALLSTFNLSRRPCLRHTAPPLYRVAQNIATTPFGVRQLCCRFSYPPTWHSIWRSSILPFSLDLRLQKGPKPLVFFRFPPSNRKIPKHLRLFPQSVRMLSTQ